MAFRLALALLGAALAVQSQPAFKSTLDLLRLDVAVVDEDGRPARELRAEDFEVRVGGQPRRVTAARFYGPPLQASPAAAPPAAVADNTHSATGRVLIFVVDLESMNAGYGKLALDTASRMLDALGPSDAVGLLPIPGKGVELTREHARVREALAHLSGLAPRLFQRHVISIREAEGLQKGDRRIFAEVVERECRQFESGCVAELRDESRQILVEAERRIQAVVGTLSTLNARLLPLAAPKSIVVLSAGLPSTLEGLTYFSDLQKRVAETGTLMYVVQLEQPDTDAGSQRLAGSGALPRADLGAGLANIAGVSGGRLFTSVGKATGVFERIQNEITSSYQLGVELQPQDADGRAHDIVVRVLKPGLTARARKELIATSKPAIVRTPVEALTHPTDFTELPIAVSAYSTRGDESTTLKVILSIEAWSAAVIGTSYAISIAKDGQPVFESGNTTIQSTTDAVRAVTAAQLAPGRYRLRAAVVDPGGRTGSLEMPLAVGLRPAGSLQLSDLFVGPAARTAGDRFAPSTLAPANAPLDTLLEIYTAEPAEFDQLTVAFELRRTGQDDVVATAVGRLDATDLPRRRVANGQIAARGLAPGSYTVSAIVRKGSTPVAKVSRAVTVTAP
jgi:VWFA-related protein